MAMSLKGKIQPDHLPLNKFQLSVVGLIPITFLSVSGLETEVDTVDLPDRTKASGGQVGTSEITVSVPAHHANELFAMELWLREAQDPVTPTYKKSAILSQISNSGAQVRSWSFDGCFVMKRSIADMAIENEGEMATVEFTMSCDEISLLGLPL